MTLRNKGMARLSRRVLVAGVGLMVAVVLGAGISTAHAASKWPHSTVTMIVPFKPGGSVDRLARFLAPALSKELGANVKVENRPGGKGRIGYQQVQAGADDGSVFVLGVDPYLSQAIIAPKAKYGLDDWAFVSVQENDPISITVHKDSPFKTFGEIIEAARKKPNTIKIGVPAGGGPQLQLKTVVGVLKNFPFREVSYEGSTYRNALLGKHVDVVFSSASGDLAIKDNARVVAVASDDPFPGWESAEPINKALKPYGVKVPYIGAIRFVAFKASFRKKHPDLWKIYTESYGKAVNSPEFQKNIIKSGEIKVTRMHPMKDPRGLIESNLTAIRSYKTK